VNTVLDNSGYNSIYSNRSDLETYVFIIFEPEEIWAEGTASLQLLNNINGKNIHISLISGLTTYNDDSFLINMLTRTEGTIINTNNNDANTSEKVASSVVKFIGANEAPIKIISSYSLTPLSPLFDRAYIDDLYNNKNRSNDNDADGLSDYDEIAFDSNLIDLSKNDYLPTIQECINKVIVNKKYYYVAEGYTNFIKRYSKYSSGYDISKALSSVRILPINSDPTMPDSDGDGILDSLNNSFEQITEFADPHPLIHDYLLTWPLPGISRLVTGYYEIRSKGFHSGIDITPINTATENARNIYNTPYYIAAAYDGEVVWNQYNSTMGYSVVIKHNINGEILYTRYLHMYELSTYVQVGDMVGAGRTIGIAGNTGRSGGRHLHFDMPKEFNIFYDKKGNPTSCSSSQYIDPFLFEDYNLFTNKYSKNLLSTPSTISSKMLINVPANLTDNCTGGDTECPLYYEKVLGKYYGKED
jgi:murein DD-endopeptidase MepM/ murein hydrolase activator NlpD